MISAAMLRLAIFDCLQVFLNPFKVSGLEIILFAFAVDGEDHLTLSNSAPMAYVRQ
jgi:hypothetical protein